MMRQRTVMKFIISRAEGLHMRYAAAIAKTAARFAAVVKVINQDREADGKSIMQLLMLGARRGAVVTVSIEGQDAPAAAQAMKFLFQSEL